MSDEAQDRSLDFEKEDGLLGEIIDTRHFMHNTLREYVVDRQVDFFTDKELKVLDQKTNLAISIVRKLDKLIDLEEKRYLI